MLLRFVGVVPDAFGAWSSCAERGACHLRANEALNRMEPRAGRSPLVFAVPRESLAECFGDAPAMRVPEPGQHRSRGRQAEHVDELLPQQPQRDRIQQEHAFAGERDSPPSGKK